MKSVTTWFVLLSGVYDLLVGSAILAKASASDAAARAVWVSIGTLGGSLFFCGLVLIWASRDLAARGPVVAWQGLLRLLAVGLIVSAISRNFVAAPIAAQMKGAAIIDLLVAIGYFVALIAVWRWSPIALLLGRRHAATAE